MSKKKTVKNPLLKKSPCSPSAPQALENLSKLVGEFMQYWGFKRLHGEIWLNVYLSREPLDASTLAKRLKVSKASMSLALKDLFHYKVILPHSKGEKRTLFLQSNPDISQVIADVLRNREQILMQKVVTAVEAVKELDLANKEQCHLCEENLKNLEDMVLSADLALKMIIGTDLSNPDFLKNS